MTTLAVRSLKVHEVTEGRYDEMLGVLPPALWLSHGFLVGEPWSHRPCTTDGRFRSTFSAFFKFAGKFYEAESDMTVPEFRAVTRNDLIVSTHKE